jgi:4-amino-4-deoxy-L-arabinose transferase-like glycosyltransferase
VKPNLHAASGTPSDKRFRPAVSDPGLWWVLVLAAVVFFSSLGETLLWDEDEGFYASTAAEMYARGDWIVPHFNGELFGHKPPWMFWMMMLGYSMFGVSEFAARIFSAVFAVATVYLVYRLARRLFDSRVAFWSALIFGTSIMFTVVGKTATPDSFLVFFSTLSLLFFAEFGFLSQRADVPSEELGPGRLFPESWVGIGGVYACMGLATLTKGPIGFVLPMGVIGLFLMFAGSGAVEPGNQFEHSDPKYRSWIRLFSPVCFFQALFRMRPLTGILILLAVAGPWFLAVGWLTDGQFHRQFFGVHHFQRFSNSMDGHSGSLVYYPVSILIGMFPWTVLTVPAILVWWRELGRQKYDTRYLSQLLILVWIGVYLVIFSLAATKLPNYVLPAYPALSIFFAVALNYWLQNSVADFWHRASLGTLIGVGLLLLIGFPAICFWKFGEETLLDRLGAASNIQRQLAWLGLLGLPALAGGGLSWYLAEKQRKRGAAISLGGVACLTVLGLWNFAAPWANQFQIVQRIPQHYLGESPQAKVPLAAYDFFRPTMVFYYGSPVKRLFSPEELTLFWEENPAGRVVINGRQYQDHPDRMLNGVVIERQFSRFPEKGEILVLRRGE